LAQIRVREVDNCYQFLKGERQFSQRGEFFLDKLQAFEKERNIFGNCSEGTGLHWTLAAFYQQIEQILANIVV
jgi:hypothetical protein